MQIFRRKGAEVAKKIGILNAYDARNRGDQAIVLCQIELLRRKFPNAEFLVFSRHARANADALRPLSVASVESLLHIPPRGAAWPGCCIRSGI